MDPYFLYAISALAIAGYFVWRFSRQAGFVDNLVGSRVLRTVGEVPMVSARGVTMILRVHILERELGQPSQVAISMVTKAFLGVSGSAMKLTAEDAKALAALLSDASRA
jgi:hypothetical protein